MNEEEKKLIEQVQPKPDQNQQSNLQQIKKKRDIPR